MAPSAPRPGEEGLDLAALFPELREVTGTAVVEVGSVTSRRFRGFAFDHSR